MTTVVAWRERQVVGYTTIFGNNTPDSEPSLGYVCLAADSRISQPGTINETKTITDGAAKILPIRIEIFQDQEYGPGVLPVYQGQLGFAYAGSTLAASLTYSLVISCFQSIRGRFNEALPRAIDLVDFICRISTKYIVDIESPFEAIILIADPDRGGQTPTQCFKLTYDTSTQSMMPQKVELDPGGTYCLLGSQKERISKMIEDGFRQNVEYNPMEALASLIAENQGTIGGSLQVGVSHHGGFSMRPTWGYAHGSVPYPSQMALEPGGELYAIGSHWIEAI